MYPHECDRVLKKKKFYNIQNIFIFHSHPAKSAKEVQKCNKIYFRK